MGDDLVVRRRVAFYARIAVEEVGGDVRDRRYVGAAPQRLQLEAAQFEDDPSIGHDLGQAAEERDADVATDERRAAGAAKDLTRERGRRRLAAAAGDPDDGGWTGGQEQLGRAAEHEAAPPSLQRQRQRGR